MLGDDKLLNELEALKNNFATTIENLSKDIEAESTPESNDRCHSKCLELNNIKVNFSQTIDKLSKDLKRQHKIMDRSDRRQQKEYDELQALTQEIEDTQREVVFTMGSIGESRSKETGNHVKRVAEYSKLLALYYGLSESEAEMLKQASPMHDIGKVAIPDSILNKPGRFTDEEFIHMQKHAELGYEMLKSSKRPLLKAAATVAYEHHERWDGKGYPNQKSGEDIHIYGRITSIADVFDALGSDRCYKQAWDDEKIFNFFKEERGKQFDPKLVDIFFEHLDEFLSIRQTYNDLTCSLSVP